MRELAAAVRDLPLAALSRLNGVELRAGMSPQREPIKMATDHYGAALAVAGEVAHWLTIQTQPGAQVDRGTLR